MSNRLRDSGQYNKDELILCGCGCGNLRKRFHPSHGQQEFRFIYGHHNIGKGKGWNHSAGYRCVRVPEDHIHLKGKEEYILEHRLVWEQHNNACLLPWAIVHHLNEKPWDNRPENLNAMMRPKHNRIHQTKDMSDRRCAICNTSKTYFHPTQKIFTWYKYKDGFICRSCYGKIYERVRRKKKEGLKWDLE